MQPIHPHWPTLETLTSASVYRRRAHPEPGDPPQGARPGEDRADGRVSDGESLWIDLGGEG
jgi:hypothetical protein